MYSAKVDMGYFLPLILEVNISVFNKFLLKTKTYQVEIGEWDDGLEFLALLAVDDALDDHVDAVGHELLVELIQFLLFEDAVPLAHPLEPVRLVTQVFRVDVNHATSRYCCRRGVLEVVYLGEYFNIATWRQNNSWIDAVIMYNFI